MKVRRERLDNGLRITTKQMPWSKTVAVGVWLNAGSSKEADSERGIAHFTEHMVFKGTKKRSAQQIAKLIDSIGGELDAFTDKEVTCYYFRVLSEHLPTALELMSDLVTNPALKPQDIEREKGVVLQELQGVEDSPDDIVQDLFLEALWGEHPLGKPVLGTKESVKSFTRTDLKRFLHTHYTPDNAVIAAAGDLEHGRFVELVERTLGGLRGEAQPVRNGKPKPHAAVRLQDRNTEQLYFCLGTSAYSQREKEHFAAFLLDIILGGGASSRLFQEIREKRGLAYAIGSASVALKEAGFFVIAGSCKPDKLTKVLFLARREVERIKRDGVKRDELSRAKAQVKSWMVMDLESVTRTMLRLGRQELYFRRHIPMEESLEAIEAVTEDDIVKVAHEIFDGSGLAFAAVGPVKGGVEERVKELIS